MELEQSKEEFRKLGLGVATISYDSQQVLRHFADRLNITVPMLSDEDSSIIRAFGILNVNVPEGSSRYGMPFPGTYLVDQTGRVVSKYFEDSHRQRYTADTILVKEYDVGGGQRLEARTDHLSLVAYPSQDVVRRGNRLTLILRVELPEKMHVYAPRVEGYLPVAFSVQESQYIRSHEAEFPQAEVLHLPAIRESVSVYHDQFKVTRDITISPNFRGTDLQISALFEYQACDDRICYPPQKVPLTFSIRLKEHDGGRVPEPMRKKDSDQ